MWRRCVLFAPFLVSVSLLCGQSTGFRPPRMPDGHPNLNGVYEALNSANWNLQDHPAYAGPMWETGAIVARAAEMLKGVEGA